MASNDKEITRAIFNLVELGDFQALKRFTPSNFDWRQGNPEDQVPALHSAIVYGIVPRASSHADFLKIVSWMLQSGADPAQCVPSTVRATQEVATCKPPAAKAEVAYAGHAAFSLATKWLKTLRNLKGNWSNECEYLTGVMSLLTSSKDTRRPTVPVDLRFIDMWESVLDMTSTHNVTIETADGQVTAHDHILMASSPVLKAMLESAMKEGCSRRIQVLDATKAGVSLFLDVLYTCGTRSDPDYQHALVALDLAHRWQVHRAVDVLADALKEMITVDSFTAIAEAALLKGLRTLESACSTFGAQNTAIQAKAKKGNLTPAVQKLLGHPVDPQPAPKKQRRML